MLAALDAGADDVADDGGTLAGHVRAVATSTTSATRSRRPASTVESADSPMVSENLVPITDRRGRQEGAADRRGDRGQRRRPGRLRQLRHPRRRDGRRSMADGRERRRRRPGARLHAAGHRRARATRWPTTRGQPVVLVFYPGDDTPVCTKQLNTYNDGLDAVHRARRPGAGDLGPGRRQPRARSRPSTGFDVPAARRHRQGGRRRCTARSARSASRGAACSSSTATA